MFELNWQTDKFRLWMYNYWLEILLFVLSLKGDTNFWFIKIQYVSSIFFSNINCSSMSHRRMIIIFIFKYFRIFCNKMNNLDKIFHFGCVYLFVCVAGWVCNHFFLLHIFVLIQHHIWCVLFMICSISSEQNLADNLFKFFSRERIHFFSQRLLFNLVIFHLFLHVL